MHNEICLVIIYNHNYEKNINLVEEIYRNKFKNICHIMPFYTGNKENVIGVYESSYQFNGYITQALKSFFDQRYSHYVFIADDVLLNPKITENTIINELKLDNNCGFISEPSLLKNDYFINWCWTFSSVLNLLKGGNACEYQKFIPSIEKAQEKFKKLGIDVDNGITSEYFNLCQKYASSAKSACYRFTLDENIIRENKLKYFIYNLFSKKSDKNKFCQKILNSEYKKIKEPNLIYPLARAYSDFFVIPGAKISEFAYISGIFAATRIFVEVAIPTSMILTLDKIKTDNDILLIPRPIWTKAENEELQKKHNCSIKNLINNFPEDTLLYHPVKLSKWRVDIEKEYSYNEYISSNGGR